MSAASIIHLRRDKDVFFKSHPQSPLTKSQKAVFDGLVYYDHNPALDLIVDVEPFAQQTFVPVQTTTGDVRQYRRYGQFSFMVEGQPARLTIYAADHGFFLPFVDAGAEVETYPAGRYLEPEALDEAGTRFHIDFNAAYNPYCAYSPAWSCPITPAENRLLISIRAGEKLPQGAWVGA